MKPTPLLTGWTCRHLGDTAPGKAVTLPHDAMLAEPRTAISAGGTNTGWYEGYDYEYQRTLTVPENELADTHILEFEGVYHNAEVWLNGQKAAFRPYGYTNFYVDCAPYLHAGENELRVIARNADQPNSRWYSGAGIYRPVQLWKARGAHITLNGVKIRTLSLQPAIVEVRVKTTAPGTVRLTVDDLPAMQQESDGEAVFTLTLDNARLWTPETPNLYTCRVSFADDEVTETFGVRKVEWGTDGFLLNGKRYIIQGACIHHDNGLLGAVCDPDAVARKVRLLKENGYNAIRSAHNPCSKALLTECDRQGMLVMDEYITLFLAQCVNFPMQRNITFKSKGNVWYQIAWYVVAFVLITIVCSFLMGIYVPLCKQFFPPALYNVLITVINGGVQMVIYFPIYKIIFPEGEQKKN